MLGKRYMYLNKYFSYFSMKNKHCGFALEVLWLGASNKTHSMFSIRKQSILFG